MKNQFYFLLIPDKYQKYFVQMRAMHIMACIFLLVYGIILLNNWEANWMEAVALVPTSLAVLYTVIFKGEMLKQVQVNQVLRLFEIGFLGIAAVYFYNHQLWVSMVIFGAVGVFALLLLALENKIFSEQFIELNEKEVLIPQLVSVRKIPWENISNIVLRFQVLTLEMKDNSFVQQAVFHKYDVDELALFDDFIKRQLA